MSFPSKHPDPPLTRWQGLLLHAVVFGPWLGALVALWQGVPLPTLLGWALAVPLAVVFIGTPLLLVLAALLGTLVSAPAPGPGRGPCACPQRPGSQACQRRR